ncbi:MAG: phosphate acetyltransferase [Sulfuricurvum sp. PC08-66]|nr:MAG: phosphate acetyltransferase [Sulfuricurvum sp. PC08-66]
MRISTLYIAASQRGSGLLMISLGIMEMLKASYPRIAYVRPIIADKAHEDEDIAFMRTYFALDIDYANMWVYDVADVTSLIAQNQERRIYDTIIAHVKALESSYDIIVCSGLDLDRFDAIVDFDINLRIASNLNALYIPILNAKNLDTFDLSKELTHTSNRYESLYGGKTLATFINRVDASHLATLVAKRTSPMHFYLPETAELDRPTVNDVISTLSCDILHGNPEDFRRVIMGTKIASMGLENFIQHIDEGDLVIVSGDRADIIIGTIASMYSRHFPHIAGIVLTGGLVPHRALLHLIKGLNDFAIPIVSVDTDTYTTAMALQKMPARIRPHSQRKIALAMGLFATHVDTQAIQAQLVEQKSTIMTPSMFEYMLMSRASKKRMRIVLPESEDARILQATEIVLRRKVVDVILLGKEESIKHQAQSLGIDVSSATIIDPQTSALTQGYIERFYEMRKAKGLTLEAARDAFAHGSYFGTMMVAMGDADGMVSGATHTTADTIRPALQIIKTTPDVTIVSSCFFMCMDHEVLVYADCAINQNPNAQELAEIAITSAKTAAQFGIEPKIAMLSYSTGSSGHGSDVELVVEATRITKTQAPHLLIEGPIQYDAAIDPTVARQKLPHSAIAGHASVFIFPDLNTGNNTYKAVQRAANAIAVGPVLQGLNKPVNDLSRGCTIADIVNTVAITAIQAQENV